MLECQYDMEGDRLYSVKWYRNGKEFYRHIPSDSPPTAVFPQLGLWVDVSLSFLSQTFTFLAGEVLREKLKYLCK